MSLLQRCKHLGGQVEPRACKVIKIDLVYIKIMACSVMCLDELEIYWNHKINQKISTFKFHAKL